MTDKTRKYPWGDVEIIDTPGIYAGRTNHDEETLEQVAKSDLLVFVVSNNLFNPQGGAFFQELIHEMQRVGQVMLLINKMSCTPETLKKSILEVIEPYHPDDFFTSFVDAKDYLDAQIEEDEEESAYMLEESNFRIFHSNFVRFIEKNRLNSKLTTPLHKSTQLLEKARIFLSTEEGLSRDLLELLRRKSRVSTHLCRKLG